MPIVDRFRAFLVTRHPDARTSAEIAELAASDLPPGQLTVRVAYSSVNYKDALSYSGHRGVTTKFPHVPGIDAVGVVTESESSEYQPGDWVIVTGHELGMNHWGGFAEYVRVPSAWAVPLPDGLTPHDGMAFGTAGFTAAQSVNAIVEHDVVPANGPILVTGATGGVAVVAIRLLAHLGFEVVASTRKADHVDALKSLGAAQVLLASDLPSGEGPMLRERWAAVVDTVGGPLLEQLVKSTRYAGIVTTCGMVGGDRFSSSVFPFILRGVALAGIDSARAPIQQRRHVWRMLANEWHVDLAQCTSEIGLEDLASCLETLLAGRHFGRAIVRLGGSK